ncbi:MULTISPECIES: VWA domain-containing protein [unclassified Ketobacter]|uniref:VWA domain-containing protein n=1 Tax=unclassified Ketobacter TaxID=2639109 RepID=UPI000F2222AB|nr:MULTISPECIES: VWA domain-containing protein [unclassified Ketobacter]RLT88756.1 MAG: VWA domain-containing protein [Ketobacter sp. GenoA1]RLT97643.1 MAG: VWA domain-containing protein [Ketobacter sp.]
MTEFLQQIEQFRFLRPWWLLGVIPAVILIMLLWNRKSSYGGWQRVISPHLLPHLLAGNVTRQSRAPLVMLLICWLLAVVAMAGPTWQQLPQAVQKKINAQVIVLDLSLSMYAKDLAPSRLVRARLKLSDILNRTDEGLTALIVYSATPHVVTPLTDDTNTILSMVNSLSPDIMPQKGNNPVAAIEKAVATLQQAGLNRGRILLMTDDLPGDFANKVEDLISYQTPLSIMGIGTRDGAPIELPDGSFIKQGDGSIVIPKLDVSHLKRVARQLDGRFSTISTSDEDINYLLAEGLLPNEQEIKETGREFDVWDETGHWLVLLILPFAAAGYRKGWFGAVLMPALLGCALLTHAPSSMAFGWDDLWQTDDQQGRALLQSGKPEQAAETFNDPQWQAASQYKAENYAAAEQLYAGGDSAESFYNLGNSQARQQKLDEAIASYQKALQLNPELEDAQFNLDLVKKLKQQQEQQQGDGESNDQKQDQDQDQENNNQSDENQDSQSDQQEQEQDQQQDQQQQPEAEQQADESEQEQAKQQKPEENDSEQPDQPQPTEPEKQESEQQQDEAQMLPQPQLQETTEDQQALEQWLRRIPDDPGGLLRRKFEYESQLRKNSSSGDTQW